jgi:hypothetical protein
MESEPQSETVEITPPKIASAVARVHALLDRESAQCFSAPIVKAVLAEMGAKSIEYTQDGLRMKVM